MNKFSIIYDGGDVYEGSWQDAPYRGLLVIVQENEMVGRAIRWGDDLYWWFPGQPGPTGGDIFGLRDYLAEIGSPLATARFSEVPLEELAAVGVKFGRFVSDADMREALKQAAEIPGYEPKNAWLPIETLPPPNLGGKPKPGG